MKERRFFAMKKLGHESSTLITRGDLPNHLKNVLRLSEGDKITLFDDSGWDFISTIDKYHKDGVSISIIEKKRNTILPERETYLFVSIIKKDKFEWVAEKATELGVSHIIPIISDRSEKKALNIDRINKIIIEAAEQSGRGTLPVLHKIVDLNTALLDHGHVKSVAWHPSATKFVSQDVENAIGAYIGPEGGWSEKETDLFEKYRVPIRSLGPQVLRSETAVIAVISRLVF